MSLVDDWEDVCPFAFDLCRRHELLERTGYAQPRALSTGTTITGCLFANGVIIAADSRATQGPIVADKFCTKIMAISPKIYCAGAGTAADTDNTCYLVSSKIKLLQFSTGREPRFDAAVTMLRRHLFQYSGYISAALILGGVDVCGPHLACVFPHGSSYATRPYATMGSGSLASLAVYETEYRHDMSQEEAIALAVKATGTGAREDLGSGGQVLVTVINRDDPVSMFHVDLGFHKEAPCKAYQFSAGTTPVIRRVVIPRGGGAVSSRSVARA